MKKYLKSQYLPYISLICGCIAMLLQGLLFLLTRDERELVASGHLLHISAWVLILGNLALCGISVRSLSGHNGYTDNFPASLPGGIGSFLLAGALVITLLFGLELRGDFLSLLWLVLGILAVPCLIFTGFCRVSGKRPAFLFHSVVFLFLAVHLVRSCQTWSREPQIEVYGFALFAEVFLMLSAYHRTAFDSGIGRRRMQLFCSLAAGCLCLTAIPGAEDPFLYAAGSLWTLSNLCAPELPRRHRRLEPEPEEPFHDPA